MPIETVKTVFKLVKALLELNHALLSALANHLKIADNALYDLLRTPEAIESITVKTASIG